MPQRLRIAVIEPLAGGGLLHYATQLADGLAAIGHDVTLIAGRENELADRVGPARRRFTLPGEPPAAPPGANRAQALLRRARSARRIVLTWWRMIGEARRGRYDAIVLDGSFDLSLTVMAGLAFVRLRGPARLVHICHNVRPFNRWGGEQLYIDSGSTIGLLARLYPRFDLVVVHGERSRREFEETWPPTRLAVVPHGDETLFGEEPPPPADEPRILFFGNWNKVKGLRVLLEAFDTLAARRPEVRLTIAGPPVPEEGESEAVLAWAQTRGERVEVMPGYVPVEDVPAVFARARVAALPYLAVYQSGVVHLAMTMGRAAVVTDVGELPTAVADGENGLVVPAGDPAALAAALERIVCDPDLARRMGEAGRRRVQESASWTDVAGRLTDELRALPSR